MKLIVGLGNPGPKYEGTRHNIGFKILDEYVIEEFKDKSKFSSLILEVDLNGEKVIFAKPQTFMNESGRAVGSLAKFYKIKTEDILVIFDDIDRDFGALRYRIGGGDGGHRGVSSIVSAVGDNFARLRVAVQNEHRTHENAPEFVLKPFSSSEQKELPKIIGEAKKSIDSFINGSFEDHSVQVL